MTNFNPNQNTSNLPQPCQNLLDPTTFMQQNYLEMQQQEQILKNLQQQPNQMQQPLQPYTLQNQLVQPLISTKMRLTDGILHSFKQQKFCEQEPKKDCGRCFEMQYCLALKDLERQYLESLLTHEKATGQMLANLQLASHVKQNAITSTDIPMKQVEEVKEECKECSKEDDESYNDLIKELLMDVFCTKFEEALEE